MSKINYIIPQQNFEIIRDRIGAILLIEIDNQVLMGADYSIDPEIFVERSNPIDKVENPCINISLAQGSYDNKSQGAVRGTYTYNIDVYTNAKSGVTPGDQKATLKMQKLLGICRAILENSVYKTLDFAPPFINRTLCAEINIRANSTPDSFNTAMGRLSLTVVANEDTEFLEAIPIGDYWTQVKIELTEKGYQYKKSIPIP